MKLLVDMNLSPRWVGFLNDAGMRAVHWSAIGRSNAPDREILAYAVANGCVVLTHDLAQDGLCAGDVGTVVHVYPAGAFEVEFLTVSGDTQAVVTLLPADIRVARNDEIYSARPAGRPGAI